MCRWVAYISPTEPCLLSDILITPAHALTKQVNAHYLPYLIPHQLAPIDQVETITPTLPRVATPLLPTTSPPPPPHLAPRLPLPETPPQTALRLRNLALNTDGHGLVYYTLTSSRFLSPLTPPVPQPIHHRSALPLSSSATFRSLAHNTSTTCLLAHVRAGSHAPVAELNCHPFVFGRVSVMHNGSIGAFGEIKRVLVEGLSGDVYAGIQGGTDSEVLAALIVDGLGGSVPSEVEKGERVLARAVLDAFERVYDAQKRVLGRIERSSLNVCVSDGKVLVATRWRDGEEEEEPPSLYISETAGVRLNSKFPGHPNGEEEQAGEGQRRGEGEHGRHVIVASEPYTFKEDEWTLMGKNQVLMVGQEGVMEIKRIVVEREGKLEVGELS
ncbi:hypothetical protein CAC42_3473 [Sphaceloma murrayae]|uniref:Glutamine amidotransferase type-2 domain-containing protein n=1 Tax=Sphaceloma murrayae TaxID=2082308 RepID=A0A2K1R1F7_9PEZI|nr:hypothetical protein CAC42_3473 [Sphaceloma murrayae]